MSIAKRLQTMSRLILDKDFRFTYLALKGRYNSLSDEEFLRRRYKATFHRELDLESPKRYTEKLQWLKLYDRKPLYCRLVDKYDVKAYVAETVGAEYVIKTLGVWDTFDEIDFDHLPNQFVLKCTHDSGGLVICKDKSKFDYKYARRKINVSLRSNYYWMGREWPYKNIKPRIIAEQYLEDEGSGELRDYKFFSFNGETKALFIATERQNVNEETKFDFFDANFNHLPIRNGHPNAEIPPQKPTRFEEMIALANKLSLGFPHVRVDLYEVNGHVYFGELTFTHWGGLVPFEPDEWDYVFGDWLKLPDHKIYGE